ncbi:hypothetical protein JHK82_050821 [Glycine max]|nr:hypothetical protein JHK82_050821 [Glycine max]KAG5095125.1 hypothetical protein JHK84_050713 [Glycine max]
MEQLASNHRNEDVDNCYSRIQSSLKSSNVPLIFWFLGFNKGGLEVLLKSSLSEANPLNKEASSPSERRTLENVESESSVLSTRPARPAKPLSLLTLSASTSAKRPVTNSRSARHAH